MKGCLNSSFYTLSSGTPTPNSKSKFEVNSKNVMDSTRNAHTPTVQSNFGQNHHLRKQRSCEEEIQNCEEEKENDNYEKDNDQNEANDLEQVSKQINYKSHPKFCSDNLIEYNSPQSKSSDSKLKIHGLNNLEKLEQFEEEETTQPTTQNPTTDNPIKF